MVKGISKQVIVVNAPDPKLFEQAIFILKSEALGQEGVTDEQLLKEAKRIINGTPYGKNRNRINTAPIWAGIGAVTTGLLWLLSVLI